MSVPDPLRDTAFGFLQRKLIIEPYSTGPRGPGGVARLRALETSPKKRGAEYRVGSNQKVFCPSPHSIHLYSTRTSPGSAETRFDAPHFRHFASIRVRQCLTVRILRSNASFTKRSVSSRSTCFDIAFLASLFCQRGFIYYPDVMIAARALLDSVC